MLIISAPISGSFGGFREHLPALQLAYANPVVRQLLIEMHVIFEKCRQMTQHERLDTIGTLSISREYRSALLHCAAEVNDDENVYMRDFTIWTLFETMFFKQGGGPLPVLFNCYGILKRAVIWTLRSRFVKKLIVPFPDTPICLDLILWSEESFTFIDRLVQKASNELDEGLSVGEGSYWRAVCLVLIGCRFDICINFLRMLKGDKAAERLINMLSSLDWNWLRDEGKVS
ncbi:hypothetical protein COOONC_08548 [Cooperia oncophora]